VIALSDDPRRYWGLLLAISVVGVVIFETILLALATGYFTGGYQSVYVDGIVAVTKYLVSAVILDIALVTGTWALLLPLFRRFGGGPLRCAAMALIVGIAPAAFAGIVDYHIHIILGRMVSTSLLSVGSAGSSVTSAAMIGEFLPPMEAMVLVVVALGIAAIPFAGRSLDARFKYRRVATPRARVLVAAWLVNTYVGVAIYAYANQSDETLRYGLERKTISRLLITTIQRTTDWDRDGYGYFSRPADPAPLDADVHPYAVDLAGNAIDENGIAGDHPSDFQRFAPQQSPTAERVNRPHLLLIFLESFRADLIDGEFDGQPITPFLSRFAKQSGRSDQMFVHSPWTLAARDQLFRGALIGEPEDPTLVDDFLVRGYEVAHFSGQDDSYGNSAERLGFLRAGRFYDAREDIDKRTSRSVATVSLQVSWQTLLSRVGEYLDDFAGEKPLFMYVNIVDTHFPYTHDEVEEIIASPRLKRSEIRSNRADHVYRAYANTAANVDRAVERLIVRWRASFPDEPTAILITGDHGQSFYEAGTLGHGQTVSAAETRVPLFVQGIGGDWPEPVAISDLRGLIRTHLGREPGATRPRFVPDPDRWIFQYLGELHRPEQIAMRRRDGVDVVDLRRAMSWRLDADERTIDEPPPRDRLEELVWTWEDLQAQIIATKSAP
jgi:hypothetical protein